MQNTDVSVESYLRGGLSLESLVSYQEGSVVSRAVINRPAGSVTLFAFDRDQSLSEHTAPFDALVLVLDGSAEITVSGALYTVKKGEMIIMPAGKPHSLRGIEKFKMMLVMIKNLSTDPA